MSVKKTGLCVSYHKGITLKIKIVNTVNCVSNVREKKISLQILLSDFNYFRVCMRSEISLKLYRKCSTELGRVFVQLKMEKNGGGGKN